MHIENQHHTAHEKHALRNSSVYEISDYTCVIYCNSICSNLEMWESENGQFWGVACLSLRAIRANILVVSITCPVYYILSISYTRTVQTTMRMMMMMMTTTTAMESFHFIRGYGTLCRLSHSIRGSHWEPSMDVHVHVCVRVLCDFIVVWFSFHLLRLCHISAHKSQCSECRRISCTRTSM